MVEKYYQFDIVLYACITEHMSRRNHILDCLCYLLGRRIYYLFRSSYLKMNVMMLDCNFASYDVLFSIIHDMQHFLFFSYHWHHFRIPFLCVFSFHKHRFRLRMCNLLPFHQHYLLILNHSLLHFHIHHFDLPFYRLLLFHQHHLIRNLQPKRLHHCLLQELSKNKG